jgi:hypothetical protein
MCFPKKKYYNERCSYSCLICKITINLFQVSGAVGPGLELRALESPGSSPYSPSSWNIDMSPCGHMWDSGPGGAPGGHTGNKLNLKLVIASAINGTDAHEIDKVGVFNRVGRKQGFRKDISFPVADPLGGASTRGIYLAHHDPSLDFPDAKRAPWLGTLVPPHNKVSNGERKVRAGSMVVTGSYPTRLCVSERDSILTPEGGIGVLPSTASNMECDINRKLKLNDKRHE